ncbi:phage minor head protein [Solibacillus sp. FSL W8-0474]|uniref:phage minor head protein n=1 Tax=Solibacillus sp. FSL W8-0474 TaxID=2975336 RepID=UPI0030FCECE7
MQDLTKHIERINRRVGKLVGKGERDVAKRYAKTLLEIRALLAAQFEKYEQGGQLTLPEMLKHDRMKKMMREVNFLLRANYKDVYKHMDNVLQDAYLDGYYLTAHAVETATQAKLNYSTVRPETLAAMLENPVAGLTLNQRLERQRANIIYSIQQQVTQGLQNNETYSTMARRLKTELENDAVKAMRIVRTEGHRVQESAKHDAMDHATKNGVVMVKTWNTMEDVRVRSGRKNLSNHKKLNNVTIPIDADFDDGLSQGKAPGQLGAAASDINCRCFLTYAVERIEKPQHSELENMAFDEWKKERLR